MINLQSLANLGEVVGAIAVVVSFPGVQAWWHARPAPYTDSFTSFMESLLEDNPTDVQATRRWMEFTAEKKR